MMAHASTGKRIGAAMKPVLTRSAPARHVRGHSTEDRMGKLTVYEIRRLKGKRQLAQIFTRNAEEAAAANDAGVDMICTMADDARHIRKAAPNVFLIVAPTGRFSASNEVAINLGLDAMDLGADAIYCGTHSMERIRAMADVRIPVIGHVGFIPYRTNWIGGPRAIGKTADEALAVYRHTKQYEEAGAIGVEMEIVPHRVATEISRRTSLCVISMGSGSGCDAQYLFAEDVLGTNRGHVPRHAKQYRDLKVEYDRLRGIMREAFTEYGNDVRSGAFPDAGRVVEVKEKEYQTFLAGLDQPK
jgi:3-methyl-2-oxobutanoate hydroxymethyltransferase